MTSLVGTAPVEFGKVDVRPLAGHIGAEIRGVDLATKLSDDTISEIRAALLKWKVIFFREQHIGHAEQVAFARRFGKVTPAHPYEDNPPEGFPEILTISSARDAAKSGTAKPTDDNDWHTDVTALVNPPAASILRAETVPPYGGDTSWTNLVAAYENLPLPLQELADKLRATHAFASDYDKRSGFETKRRLVAVHPVVRVHPETGERALFVSPSFTRHNPQIVGMSKRHSESVLRIFYEQIARQEFTVRFKWAPGSVAFWDNRATSHLAPNDLGYLDHDRVLYRVTLEGDVPVGPDGQKSELVEGEQFVGA